MRCARCKGLMVPDHFFDLLDDSGQMTFGGWRCLCCGNIIDPLIEVNRRTHTMARPQTELEGTSTCFGATFNPMLTHAGRKTWCGK